MTTTALKVVSAHTPALEFVTVHCRPASCLRRPQHHRTWVSWKPCMRSPNFSLALRIDAANKLLKLQLVTSLGVVMVDNEEPVDQYIIGGIPDEW